MTSRRSHTPALTFAADRAGTPGCWTFHRRALVGHAEDLGDLDERTVPASAMLSLDLRLAVRRWSSMRPVVGFERAAG
jgi:hypothetical protein